MGVMYLTAPLIIGTLRLFSHWARWTPMIGLFIMCISLAMSSFCTTVPQLIVCQGILYALGGGLAYAPCILYLDEWFVKRKGFAYGIMWSGTGLAGVVLPLMMETLLAKFGFQTTLRLWSGLLFVMTAPLALFIKPRLPPSTTALLRPFDMRFLIQPIFLLYQIPNILEATGFFLPSKSWKPEVWAADMLTDTAIYLPTYARTTLGVSSLTSATTVLLVNVASVFGCIAMGWFIDRFHVTTCILLSTIGATVGIFCIWGLSTSLPALYFFCIVYGLFAGSFTSAWPGIMKEVTNHGALDTSRYGHIDPIMVFGWLAVGRGIGNVVSGPLSESLIKGLPWQGNAGFAYGSGYGTLIVFTGVTAFLGGSSFLWRRVGLL